MKYGTDTAVRGTVCAWKAGFSMMSLDGMKKVRDPSTGRDISMSDDSHCTRMYTGHSQTTRLHLNQSVKEMLVQ